MKYNFRHIDFLNEAMSTTSVSSSRDEREDPSAGFYSQSSSGHGMPRGMDGGDDIPDDGAYEAQVRVIVDWWMEALGTYEGAANSLRNLNTPRRQMSWEDWYDFFYDNPDLVDYYYDQIFNGGGDDG